MGGASGSTESLVGGDSGRRLSGRLQTIVGMVTPGSRAVDVGTDHALVPIALVLGGIVREALAADVAPGPLAVAEEHIRERGLEDRIRTVRSDGLSALVPAAGDRLIITGMGGMLIARILGEDPDKTGQYAEMVLSPQSDAAVVRSLLRSLGYGIEDERMIEEKGKFYPVLRAVRRSLPASYRDCADPGGLADPDLRGVLDRYGPVLLKNRDPVLYAYLVRRREAAGRILSSARAHTKSPQLRELSEEYEAIGRALRFYDQ